MPGDALRIEQRNLVDRARDDASQALNFAIEEIILDGPMKWLSLKVIRLEGVLCPSQGRPKY